MRPAASEFATLNNSQETEKVTDNSEDDYYPSYSPSGNKLAYVYNAGAADAEIYMISPNGGGRSPVTDNGNNDFDPYWGPQ